MMSHVVVTVTQTDFSGNVSAFMVQNLDDQTLWISSNDEAKVRARVARNGISLLSTFLESMAAQKTEDEKIKEKLNTIGKTLFDDIKGGNKQC